MYYVSGLTALLSEGPGIVPMIIERAKSFYD